MENLDEFYALVLQASNFASEGNYDEALLAYEKLIEKYGEKFEDNKSINKNDKLSCELIQARYNKSYILSFQEKISESIKAYEKLIKLYKNSENIEILEFVAKALVNKANNHKLLQDYEKAIESFDEVINNFSGFQKQVAISYHNKAAILGELQNEKQMKEVCNELIEKFSNVHDEFIMNIVSSAEVLKDKDSFNKNCF